MTAGEPMQLSVPERALRRPDAEATVADGVASVADEASDAEQEGSQTSSVLGDDAGEAVDADHSEPASSMSTPFGSGMLAPQRREITVRPLDGTVTLVVSRYLHLHADLHYTKAVDWREEVRSTRSAPRGIGGDADREDSARSERERVAMARDREGRAVLSYPFEQRRRMRSGELHYLDHPALGILVLVEPRELPAEATSQGGS
ncbi:MAG: hypothetical protein BRD57_04080 [Proteobacteria bacterium SW_6_67_9]|nr:MAG: hypothetical protein BRD57_04080 [Proteobacteria bacterium SW_6_67_9]